MGYWILVGCVWLLIPACWLLKAYSDRQQIKADMELNRVIAEFMKTQPKEPAASERQP